MTNMFKKSLVALALAGASTGVMAADISATTKTVSNQYLSVTETVVSNNISVTLQDEYATDDFLVLKFDGNNVVDPSTLNQQFQVAPNGAIKGMTIDFVTSGYDASGDFTWVKFRITELDDAGGAANTTVGAIVDFGTVTVDSADLLGNESFNVAYTARLSYDNYDPEVTNFDPLDTNDDAPLFSMDDQFAWGTNVGFDETVDVITSYRTTFEGGGLTDSADIVVTNDTSFDLEADFDTVDITVTGDNMFGWVTFDANDDQDPAGQLAAAGCTLDDADITADSVMYSCPTLTNTLVATLNGVEAAEYGEFSVSAVVNYSVADGNQLAAPDDASTFELEEGSLGEWDVNGSITHIPYMPYSAQSESNQAGLAIDQIIYITNDSTRDYDGIEPAVYVEVLDEDGTKYTLTNEDLGSIKVGNGITKITGQVREALFEAGKLNSSKKLSLTVVVEENPENIEVYSAYNVGGSDRGWVQNDSQRVFNNN